MTPDKPLPDDLRPEDILGPSTHDDRPAPRVEDILPEDEVAAPAEPEPEDPKKWYILKVASNRETSISEALRRRVRIAHLEEYVAEIIVPVERVREINPKTQKQRIVNRKLYPGYIIVHMEITDDTWFVIRETPGVGDFTGAHGKPIAMQPHEVNRILDLMRPPAEEGGPEKPDVIKLDIKFKPGDRVRIVTGNFEGFEGDVQKIDERSGRVTVELNVLGQTTPVEFDYTAVTPM